MHYSLASARVGIGIGALLVLALAPSASAQRKLWIVGHSSCPGIDFTEVQPAIDAAAEGDVILVRYPHRGGVYGAVTIDGKSLVIVADGRNSCSVGPITIRNLQLGQSVLLQGVTPSAEIPQMNLSLSGGAGLQLIDNAGPVWVESWKIQGVSAIRSTSAVFARCTANTLSSVDASSSIFLYDCSFRGVDSNLFFAPTVGIWSQGGTVYLSGSTVTGGNGSNLFMPFSAASAVSLAAAAKLYTLDSTLTGGANPSGPPAPPISGTGQVIALAGSARSYTSASPILELGAVPLTFAGEAGDLVAPFLSAAQRHVFYPGLFGVLAPAFPAIAPLLGAVGPGGTFATGFTLGPGLVPGGEAVVIFGQGLFQDTVGRTRIGSPAAWVLLDEALGPLEGCDPGATLWVDDDAASDPGPGNPSLSDPAEDGSPEHPFDALQEAIDAAVFGNTVMLRDGVYSGPGNHDVQALPYLTIKSENGPASCSMTGASDPRGITVAWESVVEGITFRQFTQECLRVRGNVTIRNCVTESSTAGIVQDTSVGILRVEGCVVDGNTTGIQAYALELDRCWITNNRTVAGAGTGIAAWLGFTLRNSIIAGNAVGLLPISSSTSSGKTSRVIGCTFVGNTDHGIKETSFLFSEELEVRNTILWGNTPKQIVAVGGTLDIDRSVLQGGIAGITAGGQLGALLYGAGNLALDPQLVTTSAGAWHLSATSPCIDAGDPAYAPLPGETDIDGEARVQGGAVDIGADEVR